MRRRSARIQAAGLVTIALGVLGCSSTPAAAPSTSAPATTAPPVSGAPTSTPQPTPSARTSAPVLPPVNPFPSLADYLAHRSGQVTAAVFDARTRTTWLFHPGMVQDTASIVKVEIMGALLRDAEVSGRPLTQAQTNLMTTMIENSDNTAATALWAEAGGPAGIGRFDRSIGMDQTTPSTLALIPGTQLPGWGLTTTSARDEVTLVSKFAFPNLVFNNTDRRYGLSLMEHIEADQAWGVGFGLPAGTTVALKNGWVPIPPTNQWQVNSIGWVKGHGRNYVLAVLTQGNPSEAYGIATIETIAARVFADLSPNR
ncbi:MAG TPA: serine hydrolase [Streptosporangiaceae bacterium]|nr:serine hydrolase [Streptosporangiaceae bacterium]